MEINICDIYVPSFKFGNIPITKHPYYLSLKYKDKTIFNEYLNHVSPRQRNKSSGTWKGFKSLKRTLGKHFDYSKDPIHIRHHVCMGNGGRHRICIMAYLNIDYKVTLNKNGYIIRFHM